LLCIAQQYKDPFRDGLVTTNIHPAEIGGSAYLYNGNPSQVVDYVATITRLSKQYFGADYSSAKIY